MPYLLIMIGLVLFVLLAKRKTMTPEQIGKFFLTSYRASVIANRETIRKLEKEELFSDFPEVKTKEEHIRNELAYLNYHIIIHAIMARFKKTAYLMEKAFQDELTNYLKEKASNLITNLNMLKILQAHGDYMEQYNKLVCDFKPSPELRETAGFQRFSIYMAKRIFGNEAGQDARASVFICSYYCEHLFGHLDNIKEYIRMPDERYEHAVVKLSKKQKEMIKNE